MGQSSRNLGPFSTKEFFSFNFKGTSTDIFAIHRCALRRPCAGGVPTFHRPCSHAVSIANLSLTALYSHCVSLDIFAPHSQQCGLEISISSLSDSLISTAEKQRHPVLLNSIYLWACFVSRPEPLCQHEEYYLTQALESLKDSLHQGDRVLDIIQGSCLLVSYLFSNGRTREGSYHLGGAVSLALQYQLHQGLLFDRAAGGVMSTSSFPDPTSWERISAFWQVYNLDRCWSVVMQKPAMIPDGPDAWSSINCPWPQAPTHYETVSIPFDSHLTGLTRHTDPA